MTGGSCGAVMSLWRMEHGGILVHAQLASLQISLKLIVAQLMMVCCLPLSVRFYAAAHAMKLPNIVTVDQPLAR